MNKRLPPGHDAQMRRYMLNRHKQFLRNIEHRPFWQWVAVGDYFTCRRCAALNGKVFLHDDPIWQTMLKRLHRGCRCRFRALTHDDLQERGLKVISSLDGEGVEMDAHQDQQTRQKLAAQVEKVLHGHKVNPEDLGSTVNFLCNVIGGMIGVIFPSELHNREIDALRDELEYGIEHGVPED